MAEFFNKFQLMLKLEKKSKKSLTLEESHLHQVSFYDIYLKNLMDKFFLIHFFVQLIFFSIFVVWKTNIKQDTYLKTKTLSL